MTNGQKVFITYFAIFLFMPAVAQAAFGSNITGIYWVFPPNLYAIGSACFVFIATLIITSLKRRSSIRAGATARRRLRLITKYERHRLALSIVALILSITYSSAGFLSFRYTILRISDQNSTLLLAGNLVSIWVLLDLTYRIFADPEPSTKSKRVADIILASSFLIATNGTASSLMALAFLGYALSPTLFRRVVFLGGRSIFLQATEMVGVLLLAASLFLVAWVSGEAIKTASSGERDLLTAMADVVEESRADTAVNYFYYVTSSLSTHYYAQTFVSETPRQNILRESSWPLGLPLETLWFRIRYLVGADAIRPEIGSFSRLNYILLTAEPVTERQGTSPGLLAAFEYAFGLVIGPIACVLYSTWLCMLLDRLVAIGRPLTVAGSLFLLGTVLFLFQSPFDILAVFDNATLTLVGLLAIATALPQPNLKAAQDQPFGRRSLDASSHRGASRANWRAV